MLDESNDLIYFLRSRDVMLHSTKHVLIKLWSRIEIIKGKYLISMLKLLSALCFEMVSNDDKFLALMFAEPTLEE